MAKPPPTLVKPTLDKDLDKIAYAEAAAQQVWRGALPVGIGLIFLILATLFAGFYVVDQPGAIVIIAAAAVGAYMAMNIGANDVTNNVGAAVGARAISMSGALVIAAIFEIAGALIAGGDVIETISEGILDPGIATYPAVFSLAMMAALLASALWVNFATWTNSPVSTTHSIVGAVMGAGIAAGGLSSVNWSVMAGITVSWMVSPLLGGAVAALILYFIKDFIVYRADKIAAARRWVPVLIAVMAGSFASYLTMKGIGQVFDVGMRTAMLSGLAIGLLAWLACIPLIRRQSEGLENRNQSLRILFRLPLVFSAALLSFAHGANDVANAIGPLAAIVHAARAETVGAMVDAPNWVTIIGALGISAGLLLFGPKLIRLVGSQITKLNPMRAFSVALSAAVTVIIASWFGLPVSSTHIAVGAVFGVGFFREWYTRNSKRRIAYMRMKADHWEIEDTRERNPDELRRRYLVRRSHFMTIVAAWVITVPASAGLAALLYWVMYLLFL
ncbi:inorganic phosphate transporter [Rhizobium sp. KAs_5_22]|uniref:inorganic phosphate transporter n=1 Tax=Ciceribacter selenitireducens TaxID=448181 RepID=UPI00049011A8|nr:inorganic phosphate transporter [Ciceribacter selenitireducens]PPJ47674.1 inorganic phosphate transporter [Rhizobium sp. KAs_5_22]